MIRRGYFKSEAVLWDVPDTSLGERMMSIEDAVRLDDPEGSVSVRISATLLDRLVRYRDAAQILAKPDDDEEGEP